MLSPAASGQGTSAKDGSRGGIEDLETDRLFSSIDFSGGALVAVSGGSDSTALLLLAKQYLDRTFPAAPLLAVTVDHALRSGSAAEAESVADLCARNGISHRTLRWNDPKPATGVPAAAREARYRLLAAAARNAGIGMVLTGHTADDQAETVLMRKARTADGQADERGLAGMAPATLYEHNIREHDVWIVRPLLSTRRAALRDWLTEQGVGWIDDPTNDNAAFERPRIRARLGGGDFEQALATAARAARSRLDLGRRAATLIGARASRPAPGLLRLAPAFVEEPDRQAALYALRILVATAGGAGFLPEREQAEDLLDRIFRWRGPQPLRATLSHTVVDRRAAGLFLHREGRGLPPAAPVRRGMVWDGRYRITPRDGDGEFLIAAGSAPATPGMQDVPASLVRAAQLAEPTVLAGKPGSRPLHVPSSSALPVSMTPLAAPFARFLSGFDLAPARAVAKLIGGDAIPMPPLADPIGLEPGWKT